MSRTRPAGAQAGRAGVRDRDGPAGGGRGAANVLVRAARLDADHRDPRSTGPRRTGRSSQRRLDAIRDNPNIALIERPEYKRRWLREPWDDQVQRRPAVVAARPPGVRPLLARPDADAARADQCRTPWPSAPSTTPTSSRWPPSTPAGPTSRCRSWSRSWSRPSRCRSCPCCGTSPRAWPSGRSGSGPGTSSAARTPARTSGRSPCRPSTPRPTSSRPTSGGCGASSTCPRSGSSATRTARRDGDPSLVVGWAGWDHLQQATALAAYYDRMKTREGWPAERLVPLLAGLDQLLLWLKPGTTRSTPSSTCGWATTTPTSSATRPRRWATPWSRSGPGSPRRRPRATRGRKKS